VPEVIYNNLLLINLTFDLVKRNLTAASDNLREEWEICKRSAFE
jgi:hypothetical protein